MTAYVSQTKLKDGSEYRIFVFLFLRREKVSNMDEAQDEKTKKIKGRCYQHH